MAIKGRKWSPIFSQYDADEVPREIPDPTSGIDPISNLLLGVLGLPKEAKLLIIVDLRSTKI